MNDWTGVYGTNRLYLAHIVKDLLENEGIEAVILNQQDSSYKFGDITVMVNEGDKEKALDIIKSAHVE